LSLSTTYIYLVVSARSARGLSLPAYVLETLAYAFTLAYSYRNQFPFSTYGENFFLTLQNILITFLIIAYAPRSANKTSTLAVAAVMTAGVGATLYVAPLGTLAFLQLSTLPLSLFSKIPQIRQNYRSQSTGQLSVFAVASQVVGCLARLFTTAQEVGDSLVAAGFALALVLNCILGVQLWLYWGQDEHMRVESGLNAPATEKLRMSPAYEPVPWQAQSLSQRVATPPPQSPAGNRKWARKVD
jgi:mannose-P-dolichol utilization defect 1